MKTLARFYDFGAFISFLAMMGCVLLEVVTRNIIHVPTTWAEELSRFMCVWTVFLGSASAWHRYSHIVINVLPRRLSGIPKFVLELFTSVLSMIFLLCVWIGGGYIMYIQYEAKTTALEISISYFYLGLFIGAMGMVIFHANMIKEIISRGPHSPQPQE